MEKHKDGFRLSGCALGIALGITWGLGLFVLGVFNIRGDWGGQLLDLLSSIYLGFNSTFIGACIGFLWGLFEGFVSGVIIALVYNFVIAHCSCRSCSKSSCRHKGD